jgi:hypothetical protein
VDAETKTVDPTPVVRLGRVASSRGVRRAVTRIVDAVLAGHLSPKVGNTAIYGLQTIQRVLESEMIEARLAQLENHAGINAARVKGGSQRLIGHA